MTNLPPKIFAVCLLLILPLSIWLVQHIHLNPMSRALEQYLSLMVLALTICAFLKKWAADSYSHIMGLCIVLFTLMWGRVIFCGYLYYDEVLRIYSIPPLNRWLITPVNDHLTPLMWMVWAIQYGVFSGDYWFIALSQYSFGLLAVCGMVRLIQISIPSTSAFHSLGILFACLSTLSPRIWIWKGCGDSPVIALSLFVWLYYHCVKSEGSPSYRGMAALLTLYLLLNTSCSAITLGFVYFLPLLIVPRFRTRRFLALLLAFFSLSVSYWWLRLQIVPQAKLPNPHDLFGAFAKVWFTYSGGFLFSALLALLVLSGPWFFIRQRRPLASALWATGFLMYGLGTVQLWGARHLVWNMLPGLTEYHMLLPYAGISLLAGASIACWSINWNLVAYTLICVLSGLYLQKTARLAETTIPDNQAVIKARGGFFEDLRRVVRSGSALPDRSVGEMSYAYLKRMDWTDINLFTDPESVRKYGAPSHFSLNRLTYIFGRETYPFLPANTPFAALDATAQEFVTKYWPMKRRGSDESSCSMPGNGESQ